MVLELFVTSQGHAHTQTHTKLTVLASRLDFVPLTTTEMDATGSSSHRRKERILQRKQQQQQQKQQEQGGRRRGRRGDEEEGGRRDDGRRRKDWSLTPKSDRRHVDAVGRPSDSYRNKEEKKKEEEEEDEKEQKRKEGEEEERRGRRQQPEARRSSLSVDDDQSTRRRTRRRKRTTSSTTTRRRERIKSQERQRRHRRRRRHSYPSDDSTDEQTRSPRKRRRYEYEESDSNNGGEDDESSRQRRRHGRRQRRRRHRRHRDPSMESSPEIRLSERRIEERRQRRRRHRRRDRPPSSLSYSRSPLPASPPPPPVLQPFPHRRAGVVSEDDEGGVNDNHHHRRDHGTLSRRRPGGSCSRRRQRPSSVSSSSLGRDDTVGHFRGGPGTVVAHRYKIVDDVGMGTFGRVVECLDLRNNRRPVAIKIVRSIQRYCESARIEASILQDVNRRGGRGSTHCAVLHDAFTWASHYCMVFENLGPSLYDFVKRHNYQPFPMICVRDFSRQLLETLEFIHSLHLIHTDLKPENILLTNYRIVPYKTRGRTYQIPESTRIKLIDFGGATYDDEKKSSVVNTRQYRAPEVILGVGWSMPSDMWSAGCILAELYKGELLFATHDNAEHLGLMEATVGPFRRGFLKRAKNTALVTETFDSAGQHRLGRILPPESASYVRKTHPLEGIIRKEDQRFLDLLKRLLVIDPAERASAHQCVRHRL